MHVLSLQTLAATSEGVSEDFRAKYFKYSGVKPKAQTSTFMYSGVKPKAQTSAFMYSGVKPKAQTSADRGRQDGKVPTTTARQDLSKTQATAESDEDR